MATYYLRTDGNDSNDGSADDSAHAWRTLSHAGASVAAGDTVMVRATAGNAASWPTSSFDYSEATYFIPTSGSAASGRVRWIGHNGIPTIGAAGLLFYNSPYHWFEGLYFCATSNANGSLGIINGNNHVITDCIFNQNDLSLSAMAIGYASVKNSTIYGGSTTPTQGAYEAIVSGNYDSLFQGLKLLHCTGRGITMSSGMLLGCIIHGCRGDGVDWSGSGGLAGHIIGNTINANEGHGINVSASNVASSVCIRNNCITNHTQSGKAGISCATSGSNIRKLDWGYNNVWNNTTDYTNVTADATDLSVDPDYVDAANYDFTPQEPTLLGAAFPTQF